MSTAFRLVVIVLIIFSALIIAALFVLPKYEKNFVKVEFEGKSVLAELALTPEERKLGLSGRAGLPESVGMLFAFNGPDYYGMWMKGMKFPLDIIWIKGSRVADLEERVLPAHPGVADSFVPVYRPDVPADFVLEVRAGFIENNNIRIGDKVKIVAEDPRLQKSFVFAQSEWAEIDTTPGYKYFIGTLKEEVPDGGDFRIEKMLAENDAYRKFQISYRSGDLTISGVMNIPAGEPPKEGYPVIILNHGLIRPEIYFTGRGSRREQNFLARHGYVTIHPDYRGLASSSPNTFLHHDFYVGYTEDVINLIDTLKKLNSNILDTKRMGMWGHSMGGGITTRVMVLSPDIRAFVLFAPISARVEDNFYELSKEEIGWLEKTYGTGIDAFKIYRKISPLTYFAEAGAPVQIHHGTADSAVPIAFSEKIFKYLQTHGKKVEFFQYAGEGYEFDKAWDIAAERMLQFFDKYVKNAR